MIIKTTTKLVKFILLFIIILFEIMFLSVEDKFINCGSIDYCYSDIGCFPLSPEFYHPRHRPFNVRPWHRKRVKTKFELFNRKHSNGYMLVPWDKVNLIHSGFNPNLETKIIIPGWLDNIRRVVWVRQMKDAFLWLWKPCNIIVIHWRNFTPYTIATANTRVVGAELANLLKFIEHQYNYNRLYYHLIGHSLGAHISGYCGDRLPGLGRITALDPARPFFQHMPKSVRLDRGDARFVDAIHSDFTPENAVFLFMSFGMTTPVGHVDFYPNGPPLLQPGCLRDSILAIQTGIQKGLQHNSLPIAFLESIRYLTACDHQRSHQWFIESITNRQCLFVGVRCNEFEGLINGRCTCDDSKSACAIMGIYADQMYINHAHEDLWPYKKPFLHQSNLKEEVKDQEEEEEHLHQHHYQSLINHNSNVQKNRNQIYNDLKYKAFEMRHPPIENLLPDFIGFQPEQSSQSVPVSSYDDIELENPGVPATDNIEQIKNDIIFYNYLRSTLLLLNNAQLFGANNNQFKKRQSTGSPDDDLGLTRFLSFDTMPNGHPKLMSDLDRNIENWYEETSRWYLKTNNKPNFCVNQYQVLVFIGPLRTTTHRENMRANLILTIIGSHGQITNQRFKPRSGEIDSYTMQPFFILLEGSYSLGSILSVAIGWETRYDLDPVQATISFESNLLESVEPILPNYKAKHPWLSETMKYDYSRGFNSRLFVKPNWYSYPSIYDQHRLSRRSSASLANIDNKPLDNTTSFGYINNGKPTEVENQNNDNVKLLALKDKTKQLDKDDPFQFANANANNNNTIIQIDTSIIEKDYILRRPKLVLNQIKVDNTRQKNNKENQIKKSLRKRQDYAFGIIDATLVAPSPSVNNILPHETIHGLTTDNSKIAKAKFHNIGIHKDYSDFEDSITINKVIVSPLQAGYGKSGRVRKIFCPPRPNYRLKREQTVRLQANMMSRCDYHFDHHHHPDHHPALFSPVRVVY